MNVDPSRFTMEHAVIGEGGYGKVHKGTDTSNGEKVAVKLIDTKRMKKEAIEREVRILDMLNHRNIIGLRGYFVKGDIAYIIMEMAGGGELFDRVIDAGAFPEATAKKYFAELIHSVYYCHTQGVAHRDLKLENVLLDTAGAVKICDFGLAHVYKKNADGSFSDTVLYETCGSKSYAAPELLRGKGYSGYAADVWSCGICLFAMLAGFFPLDEATSRDWRYGRLAQAQQQQPPVSSTKTIFGFYGRPCPLSAEVVQLLDGMISIDPRKRFTMQQVMAHPWMAAAVKTFDPNAEVDMDSPMYRSAIMPTQMSTDGMQGMELDDEEPVYRSMGAIGGTTMANRQEAKPTAEGPPPMLSKQKAMSNLPVAPIDMAAADPMSDMAALNAAIS